jgi:hypothetical protein
MNETGTDARITSITSLTMSHGHRRSALFAGIVDYVQEEVLTKGRDLVPAFLHFIDSDAKVGQTTKDDALAAAVNLVEGTSRMNEQVPAPRGVGGPVDAVLLGVGSKPTRLRWK